MSPESEPRLPGRRRLLPVLAAAALAALVGTAVAQDPAAEPEPGERVRRPATERPRSSWPAAVPGDGIWIVGADIAPGTYRPQAPGPDCYWARLYGSRADVPRIAAHGTAAGQVAVLAGDAAFETVGCGRWVRVEAAGARGGR